MRAVVWKGPREVAVEELADPKLGDSNDAILRLTTSAICGSDLHMYEGRTQVQPGQILGHENLGVIEAVGASVKSVNNCDRVFYRSISRADGASIVNVSTQMRA